MLSSLLFVLLSTVSSVPSVEYIVLEQWNSEALCLADSYAEGTACIRIYFDLVDASGCLVRQGEHYCEREYTFNETHVHIQRRRTWATLTDGGHDFIPGECKYDDVSMYWTRVYYLREGEHYEAPPGYNRIRFYSLPSCAGTVYGGMFFWASHTPEPEWKPGVLECGRDLCPQVLPPGQWTDFIYDPEEGAYHYFPGDDVNGVNGVAQMVNVSILGLIGILALFVM